MKGKSPDQEQLNLYKQRLVDQLNPKHPLYRLSERIPWAAIEQELSDLYSSKGRPAQPIRLMVGLLILKQLRNLSDEAVVERWVENGYYQFFCGEVFFQWEMPCHPTDLVYFRRRIGTEGVEKIFQISIELHGAKAMEPEVLIDTTVQEKNITFPTDSKIHRKIAEHCVRIAAKEGVELRQTYRRIIKSLVMDQRFRNHPKNRKKAIRASRKLKTIAGRLVRDLQRKLPADRLGKHLPEIKIFEQVLAQEKNSKNKIYSLHEPDVYCMSKGKEHKRYEFGAKASVVVTKNSGIVVGAVSHVKNVHDSKTLIEAISQTSELRGRCPKVAICDRGYRGKSKVGETLVLIPTPPGKKATAYQKQKARKRFRRRAGIEPVIGHLKSDYRLIRNYLKGQVGDQINLMMAAAAFNFKKWMREMEILIFDFLTSLLKVNENQILCYST